VSTFEVTLRRLLAGLASSGLVLGFCGGARAQSTVWDSTISNSHWYVPVPQLLAYASSNTSFSNPVPIGDQTLWSLGVATNGAFSGLSSAQLAIGPVLTTSDSAIQGFVNSAGQITMVFTPIGGGATTIGLGQMQTIGGVTSMEMQMITGTSLLVTHWAYMTPYNPAVFTPPSPQVVFSNSSPQWAWTAGTPWKIVSPALFGTAGTGRFIVTNYQSGYFWGRGVGPNGSPVTDFTLLGSITPQGKVLFNTLSQGTLTSLYGDITGDPSSAQMLTSEYNSLGMPTGEIAFMQLVKPYTETVAGLGNRSALGAAQTLYRIAGSSLGLDGAMAPAINALDNLNGSGLSTAISQTVPVLAGAATQATYNTQRAFQRVVESRLEDIRGFGLIQDIGPERNAWLKPFGGAVRQSAQDGVAGYNASGGGIAAGIDKLVSPTLLLGGVFARTHNTISGSDDAVPNKLDVESYQGGVYGAYAMGDGLVANFQFDGGLNRNAENRSILFMNSLASANYNGSTLHAGLNVRKTVPMGSRMALVPSLGLDAARVHAEAYSEAGADALDLNVDEQTYRELRLTAGLKAIYQVADRVHFTARAAAGYNTLQDQADITASFAGGGDSFVTYGLNVSPWLYSFGVGLIGSRSDTLDLGVYYDLQTSSTGLLNQFASAVLKVKF
jgi:outer membrane autotransporter protein